MDNEQDRGSFQISTAHTGTFFSASTFTIQETI